MKVDPNAKPGRDSTLQHLHCWEGSIASGIIYLEIIFRRPGAGARNVADYGRCILERFDVEITQPTVAADGVHLVPMSEKTDHQRKCEGKEDSEPTDK